MPLLEISTNTSIENIPQLAEQASRLAAEILGKPESYVMVRIHAEQALIFAGTDEPAAHIKLKSLGLPQAKTPDLSAAICDFLTKQLAIHSARIYIEFSSPERHMWGWDNGTF
jgi:phenylpyruvate tautomerase